MRRCVAKGGASGSSGEPFRVARDGERAAAPSRESGRGRNPSAVKLMIIFMSVEIILLR